MLKDRGVQEYLRLLPAHEAGAVKRHLDQLRRDCGCGVGGIVMLTSLTGWIFYMWPFPVAGSSWQRDVLTGIAVLLISGVIGKLMGLMMAQLRFSLTIRRLRQRVPIEGQ